MSRLSVMRNLPYIAEACHQRRKRTYPAGVLFIPTAVWERNTSKTGHGTKEKLPEESESGHQADDFDFPGAFFIS